MPTNADPTHAPTPQSGLINEEALWATIRRLFDCRPATVLGELIQNAARSASGLEDARRRLSIDLDEEHGQAVFTDWGCGLDGIAGLRTLLTLGESAYADPAVALHQHPMGLGLYSLVAHPQVRAVTIESAGLALDLDTARWWTDGPYRLGWAARIQPGAVREGLRLTVGADQAFVRELGRELPTGAAPRHVRLEHGYPFQGYAGLLTIARDGIVLDTRTPAQLALAEGISTGYQGNLLRLALPPADDWTGRLVVNWYGQLIVKPLRLPLAAYLEVRTGRPLTPLAPVRAGLVEDEAFAAFLAVCRETLFTHLVGLGADEVTVPTVRGLFRLWPERARSESPFLLAQRLRPFDRRRGVDQVYDLRRHEVVLLPREALPATPLLASHLLIVGTSEVAGDPEPLVAEHGLVTLLAAAGQEAVLPDPETGVPYERVAWWRPGPTTVLPGTLSLHASDSGHWGLGTDTQPPPVWLPLPPGAPILAVIEADSYDIDAAEFVAASPDPVALLQIHGRLAFCRDDEEADESEQSFHDSVDILVRRLLGDAVPRLDLDPLRCLLGFEAGRVAEIRFDYDPEHPSDDRYVALVVRTVTGVTRRLRVYA